MRRVVGLCGEGKLPGAIRSGRKWKIPAESVKQYISDSGRRLPEEPADDVRALLPVAVGNTSFIEISSECYYVDKTLLIRDLIDGRSMVTLFTRPRRFGKTLAINMIKTFFEKSEEDTSRYFIDKKIWQCGEKYRSMQGKYPVIMLTFKDVKYDTWEESMEAIRLIMELGINCVKLLPVFEFDEQENRRTWEGRREQERKLVLGPRSLAVLISAKAK